MNVFFNLSIKSRLYSLVFGSILDKDESIFKSYENQLKGLATPTPETNPTAKGFVFNGWENVSSTITGNANYASKWLVDSDEDGVADEEEFKIEFIVDNKVVKTEYLTEGQNPTAPTVKDTNTDNRVFKGWNPTIAPATKDARYTAQFAEDTNNDGVADSEQFLIEFYNENELVSSDYYSKNATVTAPVLTDTDKDNKVHTGWTPEFNATATAAVKYNAVWKDDVDNDGIADESEKKWTVNYYLISVVPLAWRARSARSCL